MKHTYSVSGMTCNGCKNSVEKALLALSDINTAEVNLEENEVEIDNLKIKKGELKKPIEPLKKLDEKLEKVEGGRKKCKNLLTFLNLSV